MHLMQKIKVSLSGQISGKVGETAGNFFMYKNRVKSGYYRVKSRQYPNFNRFIFLDKERVTSPVLNFHAYS